MENYLRSKRTEEILKSLDALFDEKGNYLGSAAKIKEIYDNDAIIYDEKNWPLQVVLKPKNPPMNLYDFINAVEWEKVFSGNYSYLAKTKSVNIQAKLWVRFNHYGAHNQKYEDDVTICAIGVPVEPDYRTEGKKFTEILALMCESRITHDFELALVHEMTILLENKV